MKKSQKALLASMVTLSQGVTAMAAPVRVSANTQPIQSKNTTVKKETTNVAKSGYTFVSAPASEPVVENNIVTITHVNGEKTRITFLENLLIYNRVVDKMKVVYPFYESVIIKKPKKVNV